MSRRALVLALASLAACRGEAPSRPPTSPGVASPEGLAGPGVAAPALDAAAASAPASQPAAAAACLAPAVAAAHRDLVVDVVVRSGETIKACGDLGEGRACLRLDLATGPGGTPSVGGLSLEPLSADDVDHVPAFPPGFDDGLRLDDARPVTRVCTPATQGCKDLHADRAVTARFNGDKSRAVLTAVNASAPGAEPGDPRPDDGAAEPGANAGTERGGKTLYLHDVPSQSQLLALPLPGTTVGDCSFAAFAGPSLVVGVGPCEAPFPAAFLADPTTGARLAPLGGEAAPTGLRDGQFVALGGPRWAFRAADGSALIVQDVTTGAVEARIPLAATAATARSEAWLLPAGAPGAGAALHLVSQAATAPATFTAIDLAGKTATPLPLPPACP